MIGGGEGGSKSSWQNLISLGTKFWPCYPFDWGTQTFSLAILKNIFFKFIFAPPFPPLSLEHPVKWRKNQTFSKPWYTEHQTSAVSNLHPAWWWSNEVSGVLHLSSPHMFETDLSQQIELGILLRHLPRFGSLYCWDLTRDDQITNSHQTKQYSIFLSMVINSFRFPHVSWSYFVDSSHWHIKEQV